MKKRIIFLLIFIFLAIFPLNSCGKNEEISEHVHTYSQTYSYDANYHWYQAICGHDVKDSYEEHTYSDWLIINSATEQSPGSRVRYCTKCGYKQTDIIEPGEHVHTYETTYSFDEHGHYFASTCGHTTRKDYEEHKFSDFVVTKEPSATQEGEKTRSCSVCGYNEIVKISKLKSYTITWKNDDGTILKTDTSVLENTTPEYTGETPFKESDDTYNYTFDGWDKKIVAATMNTTYTAVYKKEYINYKVTYLDYDNKTLFETEYHYNDSYQKPSNPENYVYDSHTYTFSGWKDISDKTNKYQTTYIATYTCDKSVYNVTFVDFDDTVLSKKTYKAGETYTIIDSPTRKSDDTYEYEFSHWSTSLDEITGDYTFKANYKQTYVEYLITFDMNGGNSGTEKVYARFGLPMPETLSDNITSLKAPTFEYGKFKGYFDENGVMYYDSNMKSVKTFDKTTNTTLLAGWDFYKITIKYQFDDVIDETYTEICQDIDLGGTITLNDTYSSEKTTFLGWFNGSILLSSDKSYSFEFKGENLTITAKYKCSSYTIKYVTNCTTLLPDETLEFDSEINHTLTKDGYSFVGWFDESGIEYTRVPAYDVTLYAKWIQYDITINYTNIDAIKESETDYTTLVNASAIDTDGAEVSVTAQIIGYQEEGNIVAIKLSASGNYGVIRTVNITNIKVYGIPTMEYDGTKDYINLSDTLSASLFSAYAKDSYGNNLEVSLSSLVSYNAGDTISLVLSTKDIAGNTLEKTIDNIKVYGLPQITKSEIDSIKETDIISNELFSVCAKDSFGLTLTATTELFEGKQVGGNIIKIKSYASDCHGNYNEIVYEVNVYSLPTIFAPIKTNFKVSDTIDLESLGIVAKDSLGNVISNITIELIEGDQTAGSKLTYKVSATDSLGNTSEKEITDILVYGTPRIEFNNQIKVMKDSDDYSSLFNAEAYDSFDNKLSVSVSLLEGKIEGGRTVKFSFKTIDIVGNKTTEITNEIKVYSAKDIALTYKTNVTYIGAKNEFSEFKAIAYDSFDEEIKLDSSNFEIVDNASLVGGSTISLYIIVTDIAGNSTKSELISNIKIYEECHATYAYDTNYILKIDDINSLFTVLDDFGGTLSYTATIVFGSIDEEIITYKIEAVDICGNVFSKDYTLYVLDSSKNEAILRLYDFNKESKYELVNTIRINKDYEGQLDQLHNFNTIWYIKDTVNNASEISDENGYLLNWNNDSKIYDVYSLYKFNFEKVYNDLYTEEETTTEDHRSSSYYDTIFKFSKTIPSDYAVIGWYNGDEKISDTNEVSYTPTTNKETIKLVFKYSKVYTITLDTTGYTYNQDLEKKVVYAQDFNFGAPENLGSNQFIGWEYNDTVITDKNGYIAKWTIDQNITLKPKCNYTYGNNNTIYFGSYPQSEVNNVALINDLNQMVGNIPNEENLYNWTSYGYYSNSEVSNYMYYIDLDVDNDKEYDYRGIYLTNYRPTSTDGVYNEKDSTSSIQKENILSLKTVFWFKYEPINWKILERSDSKALIFASFTLDSQDFEHTKSLREEASDYVGNTLNDVNPNNYMYSYIRSWLNTSFYETAFNDLEKALILNTNVINDNTSTATQNSYICDNTTDKIFLLSYSEVYTTYADILLNEDFFYTSYSYSQGLKINDGELSYLLRSPNEETNVYVNIKKTKDNGIYKDLVNNTYYGIRPACWISL